MRNLFKKKKKFPFLGFTVYFFSEFFSLVILYGFIPVPIFYSNRKVNEWAVGTTNFFYITIKPRYRNDLSVLIHEVTHIKQIYRSVWTHFLLYNFHDNYRYKVELEAYSFQCLFILLNSELGNNRLAQDQLVQWVSSSLTNTSHYKFPIPKAVEEIERDFTMILLLLLKKFKDTKK